MYSEMMRYYVQNLPGRMERIPTRVSTRRDLTDEERAVMAVGHEITRLRETYKLRC